MAPSICAPNHAAGIIDSVAGIPIQPTRDQSISRHMPGSMNSEAITASAVINMMPWWVLAPRLQRCGEHGKAQPGNALQRGCDKTEQQNANEHRE